MIRRAENSAVKIQALRSEKGACRRRSLGRRLGVFLVAALVWIAVVGPWWHSWTSLELGPTHRDVTSKTLQQVTDALPASFAPGPLQAGCAVVDLTPLAGDLPLAGYTQRVFSANAGVGDSISVRAVALDNGHCRVAIVSAELLVITRQLAAATFDCLHKADGTWRRQDVYFSATHTHSGPCGYSGTTLESLGAGRFRADVTDRIARLMAEAILAADCSRVPCELASASVEVPDGIIRNRTVAEAPANRWLDLLFLRKPGSAAPLATVAVFGAHPTCRHSSDRRISGDYPGAFCRSVESQVGGVCVFLAGAVGSMAASYDGCPRDQLAESIGDRLAREAVAAYRAPREYRSAVPLGSMGFYVALPPPAIKLGQNWRLSPVAASLLQHATAWVCGLRVGDRIFLGAPADYSGTLAEQLRSTTPGLVTVVTSFNGDYVGYILPDDYYDLPKYEARTMSFFGPGAGSYFQSVLGQTAAHLARCVGQPGAIGQASQSTSRPLAP